MSSVVLGVQRRADGDVHQPVWSAANHDRQGRSRGRKAEFEVILSLGLPTRVRWLEFTVEAIFLPFERDRTPGSSSRAISSGYRPGAHAGG